VNLHVVIGADDFLVETTVRKIVGDGVGLEVIDSLNSTNAELQLADIREADASFSTPPFLDPKKTTWWKNVHFLPSGGGKRGAAEEVTAALKKFAARLASVSLPDNQHFILSGPHLLKSSEIAKTLAGAAEMVVFASGKPWEQAREAAGRVIDLAADCGLSFAPGAAEKFVARVGTDTRSLMSELAKLRDYLGDGANEITGAAIDDITSQGVGVEPQVWGVTDALGERNVEKALAALRPFEGTSGFAVLMTTVIEKFFRQLLDIAAGKTEGLTPFALRKQQGFVRNWSVPELRAARARFLTLREQAVSGSTVVDPLVVTTLVRVCRRAKR